MRLQQQRVFPEPGRCERRRIVVLPVVAALLLSAAAHTAGIDSLLDELRWKARVLLVFSANPGDTRAAAFADALTVAACEVAQRDIVLGHIGATGEGRMEKKAISDADAAELRDRLGIEPSEFQVLLIGKDGGVKARYKEVPDLGDLFSLIDGMPMRRRESRAKDPECEGKGSLGDRQPG